ncbi:hypothetical protein B0H13DRAFT_1928460 [Mycena leptocephala]|nr:hypothetical protein B0H13DRAFT_1928460 [Mycena leptocephala]
MSDQPARDANGLLRDAADMNSTTQPRRGDRKRATDKLTEYLAAEKADDDGNAFVARPKRSRAKAPRVKAVLTRIHPSLEDDSRSLEGRKFQDSNRAAAAPSAKRKQTSESAVPQPLKSSIVGPQSKRLRMTRPLLSGNDRATVEAEDDSPARPVVLYPRTPLAIPALQATNTINVTTGIAKSSRFRGLRVPTSVNSSAI